jgi:translation initiation factor 2 beta subunit (eIF-2beta)/eIF-5
VLLYSKLLGAPALRHCLPLALFHFFIVIIGTGTGTDIILESIASCYGSSAAAYFVLLSILQHLLAFLFAELGTSGAIDGNNQLIMKGRFQQKHIENVLRRYIKEYVTCHTCRSPDTILNKETRLFFLQVGK